MTDYELTQKVIGCAMRVHTALGPGLLESAYQECLCFELIKAGLFVEKQKPMPLVYSQVKLDCGYRVDIMVERRLILEIKSVDALNDIHLAQVLTYLRLANCRLASALLASVAEFVGAMTISSPSSVISNLRSGCSAQKAPNAASVMGRAVRTAGRCSSVIVNGMALV